MYRNTYLEINLKNLEYNVTTLISRYIEYKYYFGVVKANSYGHFGIEPIKSIIKSGINYLAVATLDEALLIRNEIKNIPILCFGIINIKDINLCIKNNITITICNLEYLKKLINSKYVKNFNLLKVHIKINSGMNRLGINTKKEFNECINLIKNNSNHIFLEGIYTHMHTPNNLISINTQHEIFEKITEDINFNEIPIVHLGASDYTEISSKKQYTNGCRLGIAMYGLASYKNIVFKSTFTLYSEVIQINKLKNTTLGYNENYKINNEELIAVVPIGYADGIIRKNTNRYVYINDKKYKIVGNICMDMLFIKVDESIKIGDKIQIIKDIKHINEISNHLDTIPYEVICSISNRVPRIYVRK